RPRHVDRPLRDAPGARRGDVLAGGLRPHRRARAHRAAEAVTYKDRSRRLLRALVGSRWAKLRLAIGLLLAPWIALIIGAALSTLPPEFAEDSAPSPSIRV